MSNRPEGLSDVVSIDSERHVAVVYCPPGCACEDCRAPSSWQGVRWVGSITEDEDDARYELDEYLDVFDDDDKDDCLGCGVCGPCIEQTRAHFEAMSEEADQ